MARTSNDVPAPQVANLNSLANNAAKPLGLIDFETNSAHDATIKIMAQLAAAGVSVTGTIELYFIGTQDGTDWTDGIDPASAVDVSASIKNAVRLGVIKADVNGLLVTKIVDIFSAVGNGFKQGCVVAWNKSGAATQAAGNDADYQTTNYG
ncbi:MAG: hypothetical protein GQ532_08960 [Methylomarinum sp.]|nr:hypothetical protein [Methylomarinum sp.]